MQQKSKELNLATWDLETTGSEKAATLKAGLETECRLLCHDKETFERLISWDKDPSLTDPLLKRQLNVVIRMFKPNLVPKELLEKIASEEANLALLYSNFRPKVHGEDLSENAIREILKREVHIQARKDTWDASKQIGKVLAPHTRNLVRLRNEAAKSLGYEDYFTMQLSLQEVDEKWLFETLDQIADKSEAAYLKVLDEINAWAALQYNIPKDMVGPWAWSDPFCQEDPIETKELDTLVQDVDILKAARQFYQSMHLNVDEILRKSDNFERQGKNQHAFCINIDRENDIRTLNNVQPTMKWLETVLHELGHAVYELGYSQRLPWLLKTPPHMLTTEAMALLAGRQAFRAQSLERLVGHAQKSLFEKAETSLKRRQLIFSRWVLVMTHFEKELYKNPEQDLQQLWWGLVAKFQKINSSGSSTQCDWAAKYHISLCPVYYFSYLLGELLASSLEAKISLFTSKETGDFLNEKLFKPGDRFHWNTLIEQAIGKQLTANDWISKFA